MWYKIKLIKSQCWYDTIVKCSLDVKFVCTELFRPSSCYLKIRFILKDTFGYSSRTDNFNRSFRVMEGTEQMLLVHVEGGREWRYEVTKTISRNLELISEICSKNSLSIYTLYFYEIHPVVHFKFPNRRFETSITRFLLLLSIKAQKVQYLNHLLIIHPNFSVNLPIVIIYKFCKILIQPPGEPREHHLGEVRPKRFELHKIS